MRLAIVVPIKGYAGAKQRLDPPLTADERSALAAAMAEDVLGVVSQMAEYGRYAVSDEPLALELARRLGITAIDDGERAGQSAAVRQGFEAAWDAGFSAALTIPGDVPGVTRAELETLCEFRPEVEVLMVPDRDRRGTNGLRLIPPHAIALRFGEESLALHQAEARRAHRSQAALDLPSLACDLDRPEDLAAFLRWAPDTATMRLLQDWKVQDRLVIIGSRRA